MTWDLVIVQAGTLKHLHEAHDIKLDTLLKEVGRAALYVAQGKGEVELAIRKHEP